jgi:hypothetical protein
MDIFLGPEQHAIRHAVRAVFRDGPEPFICPRVPGHEDGLRLLRKLEAAGLPGLPQETSTAPSPIRLLDLAVMLEEVAVQSPAVALTLIPGLGGRQGGPGWREGEPHLPSGDQKAEGNAAEAAWLAGTASFLLGACYQAAREGRFFESTLMEHYCLQQRLAEAFGGFEAARVLTYRALLLIDGKHAERGRAELLAALSRWREVLSGLRSLGARLCGADWLRDILPEPGPDAAAAEVQPGAAATERSARVASPSNPQPETSPADKRDARRRRGLPDLIEP